MRNESDVLEADKIDFNGHCDPDLRSTDKLLMTYTHKNGEVAEVWELRRQGCGERYSLWWKCDPWNSFEVFHPSPGCCPARLHHQMLRGLQR